MQPIRNRIALHVEILFQSLLRAQSDGRETRVTVVSILLCFECNIDCKGNNALVRKQRNGPCQRSIPGRSALFVYCSKW